MEIFLNILQGSYAYLLIFQIVVVTLLLLTLLWLIARRTKDAEERPVEVEGPVPSVAQAASAVSNAELDALRATLKSLEEENARYKSGTDDSKSLREKVRYLESKLLEYEILQEEIGTLTNLKMENQQLKEEIGRLQQNIGGPAPAEAAAAMVFTPPPAQKEPSAPPSPQAASLEGLLEQIDQLAGSQNGPPRIP